jgi:hypothetical protein
MDLRPTDVDEKPNSTPPRTEPRLRRSGNDLAQFQEVFQRSGSLRTLHFGNTTGRHGRIPFLRK